MQEAGHPSPHCCWRHVAYLAYGIAFLTTIFYMRTCLLPSLPFPAPPSSWDLLFLGFTGMCQISL